MLQNAIYSAVIVFSLSLPLRLSVEYNVSCQCQARLGPILYSVGGRGACPPVDRSRHMQIWTTWTTRSCSLTCSREERGVFFQEM